MAEHERKKAKKDEEIRRSNKTRESGPNKVKACSGTPETSTLDTYSLEDHVAQLGDAQLSKHANTGQKAQVISGLQCTYGNAYVQRLLKSRTVQAKLSVNPLDDQYEREADQVAATLTQTPNYQIQQQPEEEEGEKIRARAASNTVPEVSENLERRIQAAKVDGQPLPANLRASLEPHLGRDLGHVRVHTDAEANSLSRELQAKAFTTGQDVFFAEGTYHPDAESGRSLLGHEIAHVLQQGEASISRQPDKTAPKTRGEPGRVIGGPREITPEEGAEMLVIEVVKQEPIQKIIENLGGETGASKLLSLLNQVPTKLNLEILGQKIEVTGGLSGGLDLILGLPEYGVSCNVTATSLTWKHDKVAVELQVNIPKAPVEAPLGSGGAFPSFLGHGFFVTVDLSRLIFPSGEKESGVQK